MIRPKIQRVMWHVAWAKQILILLGYIFICMYIAGNAWGNNTSDGNLLTYQQWRGLRRQLYS